MTELILMIFGIICFIVGITFLNNGDIASGTMCIICFVVLFWGCTFN